MMPFGLRYSDGHIITEDLRIGRGQGRVFMGLSVVPLTYLKQGMDGDGKHCRIVRDKLILYVI